MIDTWCTRIRYSENRMVSTEKERHFDEWICLWAKYKKKINPKTAMTRVTT
jgi:hypothetical protein